MQHQKLLMYSTILITFPVILVVLEGFTRFLLSLFFSFPDMDHEKVGTKGHLVYCNKPIDGPCHPCTVELHVLHLDKRPIVGGITARAKLGSRAPRGVNCNEPHFTFTSPLHLSHLVAITANTPINPCIHVRLTSGRVQCIVCSM